MNKYKRIFLSPPHAGGEEVNFIKETFDSNYIVPLGSMVDAFEQEVTEKVGISNAVAVASGTATMHLVLRVLGLGPRDEVIASTLTFIGGELAEDLFNRGLCLPSGTAMKEKDLDRVVSVILSCKR